MLQWLPFPNPQQGFQRPGLLLHPQHSLPWTAPFPPEATPPSTLLPPVPWGLTASKETPVHDLSPHPGWLLTCVFLWPSFIWITPTQSLALSLDSLAFSDPLLCSSLYYVHTTVLTTTKNACLLFFSRLSSKCLGIVSVSCSPLPPQPSDWHRTGTQ